MMRTQIRRTISSRSLSKLDASAVFAFEDRDECSLGDSELEIVYHRVPRKLLLYGSFHSLIQFSFFPFLVLILTAVVVIILAFGGIYLEISDQCGLDLNNFIDAWLFSVLAHFKAVLSSADPAALFWHGCPVGIAALFSQLFIGNILMSVLLSSLVFNFQSLSRRSVSRFTTVTFSRRLLVDKTETGAELVLPVVELNETDKRKVTGMKCHFYVFDPTKGGRISCIATNVEIGEAPLPTHCRVPLPTRLFSNDVGDRGEDCSVCGKQAESPSSLRTHVQAQSDAEHVSLIPNLSFPSSPSAEEVVGTLRGRKVEFIVIAEGQDPVTTDRIQVQKIFRHFELVPFPKSGMRVVSTGPAVDYAVFL